MYVVLFCDVPYFSNMYCISSLFCSVFLMLNAVCIKILCSYFMFVFQTEILMLYFFGWYWVWLLVMHNINMRIIISVLPDTKRLLSVKGCMCVYGLGVFQHWCFKVNKILVQSTKIFSKNSLLPFLCSTYWSNVDMRCYLYL